MEGTLKRRGAGSARWETLRFRLDESNLQSFAPEDTEYSSCRDVTNVNAMSSLELDPERKEISCTVNEAEILFRAASDEEAVKWYEALTAARDQGKPQPTTPTSRSARAQSGDGSATPRKLVKKKTSVKTPKEQKQEKDQVESPKNAESLKKKSTASMTSVDGGEDYDPSTLLEHIATLLKDTQLRVSDLFRHPKFNPSYLTNKDENLDAKEVAGVLSRAGLNVSVKSCRELMRLLDDSGDNTLDMRELEAALRAHKRGKEIWDIRAESVDAKQKTKSTKSTKSHLDFQRKVDNSGPAWGGPALAAISAMMDERDLRIQDLFRHPHYNPSYLESGDESMTAVEMSGVLKQAGCDLPLKDVQKMLLCMDEDGNGTIEIPELELALRKYRRGEMDWTVHAKKEKRPVNLEHITDLHFLHADKLQKHAEKREAIVQNEDDEIQQRIEDNRLGTRANIEHHEWDGKACRDRLYNERKEVERKHVALVKKTEAEQQGKIDSARNRPVRSASDPAIAGRAEGFKNIGDRLHSLHTGRVNRKKTAKRQAEAYLMTECDRITQDVLAKGGVVGTRHEQLCEEAATRKMKREKQSWANIEADQSYHCENFQFQHRQALSDFSYLHQLHDQDQARLKKKQESAAKLVENHAQIIQKNAEKNRLNSKTRLQGVVSKHKDCKDMEFKKERQQELKEQRADYVPPPLGFGKRVQRHNLVPTNKSAWSIEATDHALNTLNQIVAMRCNCTPEASQLDALQHLIEPCTAIVQEYRDAAKESDTAGEGAEWLRHAKHLRLFHDGCLMEEPDGWHMCTQPDQIMQCEEDLDKLLDLGTRAQNVLLSQVGPEEGDAAPDKITRRWPAGARWNHPRATKKAQFAYNPGPKGRIEAAAKAFVRYGPSEREQRHRHLLDLARCCLVFADGSMLREGLEQIIERFEVISVVNYYNKECSNLAGLKYVEVLVVIKCPEPFICEVRLEEMPFFVARTHVQPHVDTISKTMSELYSGNGAWWIAIEYLAKWVLHRPKENHSVTVFKRHITRKWGSTVCAWRKALGGGQQCPFLKFRETCQDVGMRPRTVEFFQAMDATMAGKFSLFEFDPEATELLIKYFWRICGMASDEQLSDPQKLFTRLTKGIIKLNNPGRIESHEFRRVSKVLGFDSFDSDRIFQYLDPHGGEHEALATLTPKDISWIKQIPQLLCLECVMLRDWAAGAEIDALRAMSHAGHARKLRTPAGQRRSSSMSSIASKSHMMVRRSSNASGRANSVSSRGSASAPAAQSARGPREAATSEMSKDSKQSGGQGPAGQRSSVGTMGSGFQSHASTAVPVSRPENNSGDEPAPAGGGAAWGMSDSEDELPGVRGAPSAGGPGSLGDESSDSDIF